MVIQISEVLNSREAINPDGGKKVYDYLKNELQQNQNDNKIVFDFGNIDVITTNFLNHAVGKSIIDFKGKEIIFRNLKDKMSVNMVRLVVSNAFQKHRDN